jgi:uncharacterized protein
MGHSLSRMDDLPAGEFSTWLVEIQGAIRGEHGSDVPCGTCTACCTSSQFVHIAPDETDALAHIPAQLLFPAPRLPRGHVLMGYDEHGRCPMLIENKCSIYAHRPRTCRTYDCRVFPATGLDVADDESKQLIAEQSKRWKFSFPAERDTVGRDAVRAAVAYLHEHREALPDGAMPPPTRLAVMALEVHDEFIDGGEPDPQAVRVRLSTRNSA